MSTRIEKYKPKTLLAKTTIERNDAFVPRLQLLPGQILETIDGKEEEGDTSIDIICEANFREINPIGTVFEVNILEKIQRTAEHIRYNSKGKLKIYNP